MSKTVGCGIALVVLALVLAGWAYSAYNGLVGAEQQVEGQWANVESAYQRRADLVPNLVATVKGAAAFEQDTLNQVIEARSRVGQVTVGPEVLDDPQRFAQFQQAQDQLSSALSRLLVVVERYPELKAVANFTDLQHQLEGTENRINVERNRFNEVARAYNTMIKRVPAAWFVRLLGWPFLEKPYFAAQPGAEAAPQVQF
jgi:LemA protein